MSALEQARAVKKEKEDKAAERKRKDEEASTRAAKVKKDIEKVIRTTFKEFDGVSGIVLKTKDLYPFNIVELEKNGHFIAGAHAGYGEWDNPNYDYRVTEGCTGVYWVVGEIKNRGEQFSSDVDWFVKEFGNAMAKHI